MNPDYTIYLQWFCILICLQWLLPAYSDIIHSRRRQGKLLPHLIHILTVVPAILHLGYPVAEDILTYFLRMFIFVWLLVVGSVMIYRSRALTVNDPLSYPLLILLPGLLTGFFTDTGVDFFGGVFYYEHLILANLTATLAPLTTKFGTSSAGKKTPANLLSIIPLLASLHFLTAEFTGLLITGGGFVFLNDTPQQVSLNAYIYALFYFGPLLILLSKFAFLGFILRPLNSFNSFIPWLFTTILITVLIMLYQQSFDFSLILFYFTLAMIPCAAIVVFNNRIVPWLVFSAVFLIHALLFSLNMLSL